MVLAGESLRWNLPYSAPMRLACLPSTRSRSEPSLPSLPTRQWNTNRSKLKLDLFEKRYAVYAAVLDLLRAIMREAAVTPAQLNALNVGALDAEFLFEDDIVAYIETVRKKAAALGTAVEVARDPAVQGRQGQVTARWELLQRFNSEMAELPKRFRPYLKLTH